jgi:hypothetical protein
MLERSHAAGVHGMIITGGSLRESKEALLLAKRHGNLVISLIVPIFDNAKDYTLLLDVTPPVHRSLTSLLLDPMLI